MTILGLSAMYSALDVDLRPGHGFGVFEIGAYYLCY